jgi:hypothetical protein
MQLSRPKHSTVVAYLALFFAMTGTAIAATGGSFILGHSNSAGRSTTLTNTGSGPALKLANRHPGAPPFTVNGNRHVVPGLNSSYLGGHPSSYYAGSVLPSGKSESGVFAAGSGSEETPNPGNGWIGYAINYPHPLAKPIPDVHVIDVDGTGPVTHCPGPGHAQRGYLCLYGQIRNAVGTAVFWSNDTSLKYTKPYVGILAYWKPTDVDAYVGGEWTVTAP